MKECCSFVVMLPSTRFIYFCSSSLLMKKWCIFVFVLSCMLSAVVIASPEFVPGQLIVHYEDTARNALTTKAVIGTDKVEFIGSKKKKTELVTLNKGADVQHAMNSLQHTPGVAFVEPNYILEVQAHPSDPQYKDQYHLNTVNARQAWDLEAGNSDVVIAIIDTGVDWDHPDLAGNIWNNTDEILDGTDSDNNGFVDDIRGYDFVSDVPNCVDADCDNEDNDPMDFQGHGTHVAGIAGAVTNNSIGVAGMCRQCSVMPVRAGYKHVSGSGMLTSADVVQAINYAVDNGADIISMSFSATVSVESIKSALENAYDNDVVLIAAAGNSGSSSKEYPAGEETVLAIASTTSSDQRSGFSNYGAWIDLAAPGSAILSTTYNDSYGVISGTSMSAPLVAGIAGLILSKDSTLSNADVYSILRSSVITVDEDEFIGTGISNAYAALQRSSIAHADLTAMEDAVLTGRESISGVANGSGFDGYDLWFGSGVYPDVLTLITGSSSVSNDSLASWDTSLLANGTYSLLLRVNESSSHPFGLKEELYIGGNDSVSIVNNSYQTLRAPFEYLYALRVWGGADDDRYHLEIHDENGTLQKRSDSFTVFSSLQQADFVFDLSTNVNDSLRVVLVTENSDNLTVRCNASNPYSYGNLSNNSVKDLSLTWFSNTTEYHLTTIDMTLVHVTNNLFSFDNISANASMSSAVISYSTSSPTNATIQYGTSSDNLSIVVGNNSLSTIHIFNLSSLQQNTTYFYSLFNCNTETTCLSNGTYNVTTLPDTIAPTISNVSSSATNDSITIQWRTDENATSLVSYGLSANFSDNSSSSNYSTIHSMNLTDLINATRYFFNVTSCDAANNCNSRGIFNQSTAQTDHVPIIVNALPVANVTTHGSIDVTCNATDDHLITALSVHTNISGSFVQTASVATNDSSVSHTFSLTGFQDHQIISWACAATDNASQTSIAPSKYFFTSLPPSITDTDPDDGDTLSSGTTSTILEVTTNELAECRFSSNDEAFEDMTPLNNTNSTSHKDTISGLSNGDFVELFILCRDEDNNTMSSSYELDFFVDTPSSGGGGGGGGSNSMTSNVVLPPVIAPPASPAPMARAVTATLSDSSILKVSASTSSTEPFDVTVTEIPVASVSDPLENVIQYFEIAPSIAQLADATIEFAVSREGIVKESVILHHFSDSWSALPTQFLREEQDRFVYSATTPHFSLFAVTAASLPSEPEESKSDENSSINMSAQSAESSRPGWFRSILISSAVLLLMVFFVILVGTFAHRRQ
ncbi:S8 family serine peptidase [Candidatus Woesearchaeota archaeon]|nr:S8 family serine peptidase [Candidatus Woesearchaeota archaeon]